MELTNAAAGWAQADVEIMKQREIRNLRRPNLLQHGNTYGKPETQCNPINTVDGCDAGREEAGWLRRRPAGESSGENGDEEGGTMGIRDEKGLETFAHREELEVVAQDSGGSQTIPKSGCDLGAHGEGRKRAPYVPPHLRQKEEARKEALREARELHDEQLRQMRAAAEVVRELSETAHTADAQSPAQQSRTARQRNIGSPVAHPEFDGMTTPDDEWPDWLLEAAEAVGLPVQGRRNQRRGTQKRASRQRKPRHHEERVQQESEVDPIRAFVAAGLVQRAWRRRLGRRGARARAAIAILAELAGQHEQRVKQEHAAVVLQAAVRCRLAQRWRCHELLQRRLAARGAEMQLQRVRRAFAERQDRAREKAIRRRVLGERRRARAQGCMMVTQWSAATQLQAAVRRMGAVQLCRRLRIALVCVWLTQWNAAARLQAAARRLVAVTLCRRLHGAHATRQTLAIPSLYHKLLAIRVGNEAYRPMSAAIAIQAAFRRMMATGRVQELRQLRPPRRDEPHGSSFWDKVVQAQQEMYNDYGLTVLDIEVRLREGQLRWELKVSTRAAITLQSTARRMMATGRVELLRQLSQCDKDEVWFDEGSDWPMRPSSILWAKVVEAQQELWRNYGLTVLDVEARLESSRLKWARELLERPEPKEPTPEGIQGTDLGGVRAGRRANAAQRQERERSEQQRRERLQTKGTDGPKWWRAS